MFSCSSFSPKTFKFFILTQLTSSTSQWTMDKCSFCKRLKTYVFPTVLLLTTTTRCRSFWPAWTLWRRGELSWLSASSSAACFLSHRACTICYQRDEKRRWQTDSAVPEHSNRWLIEQLNTATLLSHIAYQILTKCVCVYMDIFSLHLSLMHRV